MALGSRWLSRKRRCIVTIPALKISQMAQPPTIRTFQVFPDVPEVLKPLLEIAHNFWWVWHHDAVEVFRRPESSQKINFTPSWSCRGGEMMSVGLPNAGPALNVPI